MELAGADLKTAPDQYLHDDLDFRGWLDTLEQTDVAEQWTRTPGRAGAGADVGRGLSRES